MKTVIKVLLMYMLGGVLMLGGATFAQNPEFEILPKATDTDKVKKFVEQLGDTKSSENFSEIYNARAEDLLNDGGTADRECAGLGNQFASGIFNRDSILCLVVQVVRFVSNMALVVGALMIIYAGYIYAMSVFNSDSFGVGKGHEAIKRAIIGIVVVTFSYAIINFVIEAFL